MVKVYRGDNYSDAGGEVRGNRQTIYLYEPDSFVPLALVRADSATGSTTPHERAGNEEDALTRLPPEIRHLRDTQPDAWGLAEKRRQKLQQRLNAQLGIAEESSPRRSSAEVFYIHADHLGTPRELTDADGHLVWTATYKAWGAATTQIPSRRCVQAVGNALIERWDERADPVVQNLRFQGQYFDAETGLHYNLFRYYDPGCGRFISQDPIGLLGGANHYQYSPNPIVWIDPLGLKYRSGARAPHVVGGKDKSNKSTVQVSEWRRTICSSVLRMEREKFLGDNLVKVGEGKWRSADGLRQFRVGPSDYDGAHGMGLPNVPNTPHAHFEFLRPTGQGNFVVVKNVHVPINKGC